MKALLLWSASSAEPESPYLEERGREGGREREREGGGREREGGRGIEDVYPSLSSRPSTPYH